MYGIDLLTDDIQCFSSYGFATVDDALKWAQERCEHCKVYVRDKNTGNVVCVKSI